MITKYDPCQAPNPEDWIALDESERIGLVMDYHNREGIDMPNTHMHSMIHAVVEYQIAEGDKYPVKKTLDQLMQEGLDRHEAIHAIGSVLVKYLWEVGSGESTSDDFTDDYFEEVSQLTAQKWFDEFG